MLRLVWVWVCVALFAKGFTPAHAKEVEDAPLLGTESTTSGATGHSGSQTTGDGELLPYLGDPEVEELVSIAPPPKSLLGLTERVYFPSGSSQLNSSMKKEIDKVISTMRSLPDMRVRIIGHTDVLGSAESNQKLSEARAISVAKYVLSRGIPRRRLSVIGRGEKDASQDARDAESLRKERIVQFVILE